MIDPTILKRSCERHSIATEIVEKIITIEDELLSKRKRFSAIREILRDAWESIEVDDAQLFSELQDIPLEFVFEELRTGTELEINGSEDE